MSRPPDFAPIPAHLPKTVPFVGAEEMERARGRRFRAWLGANEITLPPSPKVVEAVTRAAREEAAFYPDAPAQDLTEALAAHVGLDPDSVLVGEGIDGLLGLSVRLFLAPGETAVTSLGAYPTFNYHVAGFGGVLEQVPYRGDAEDLDSLAARARETVAKLVYLSNPDNPMGSWHRAEAIERFVDAVPRTCAILLDEAYGEFAPEGTLPPATFRRPNLLRLRTFSKAFGLAGIRVGYALGDPAVISGYHRIRNHFGVSRLGQAAARAALDDLPHMHRNLQIIAQGREALAGIARENGLVPLPSATNFVTMDCGRDGAFARRVLDEMLARDLFIRMPGPEPLNRCIRISVGTPEEIAMVAEILPQALAAAQ